MKILMPVLHYRPVVGGLEIWTQNIAEQLSEKAEIFVITGNVKDEPKQEVKSEVNIFRTSLFALKNLSYSSPFYILTSLPFIFFKSLFLAKKQKIDVCHCQGFLSSFIGYLLFKILKIPYIATVQRQETKSFLKKIVYRNAVVCIGASWAIKSYFEEIGVKNIEIIPNGVDLKKFENLDRRINREKLGIKDEFVIITVARLEKVKGVKYLIEAMDNHNLQNSINCKLFIIGEGSERQNLEDLTKELNLKDKVKFLGEIENTKISEYLSVADCFVLSSLKEGFGIVILEAMAASVPVVATNVGGILDLIEDNKTGILIDSENSNQIAQAICKIYYDKNFGNSLIQNAKNNLSKYNWNNIVQKVFNIYQKICE